MTQQSAVESRCANGVNCVAYAALGEPSKLSRANPGPRCFACEERRVASQLPATLPKEDENSLEHGKATEVRSNKSNHLEEYAQETHAYELLERRKRSVLTCARGLHSAVASGD